MVQGEQVVPGVSRRALADMITDAAGAIEALRREVNALKRPYEDMQAQRDSARRTITRLDGAITHHQKADRFKEDHDDALYAARERIMREYGS